MRTPRCGHAGLDRSKNRASVRPVRAIRRFTVRPVLPEALAALGELASNLRWSWHPPDAGRLRARSTPTLWESTGRDPVRLLGAVGRARLEELAGDDGFLERLGAVRADLAAYLTEDRWYQRRVDGGRRAGGDRLLLAGVRHHRGAAAVLRRPRHPGRRPPQGGQRPRRADRRRRAALPARLLQAVAVARGLAAGDLPGPRPRRAADLAAARGRRHAARRSRSTCPAGRRWSPGSGSPASAGCRC